LIPWEFDGANQNDKKPLGKVEEISNGDRMQESSIQQIYEKKDSELNL
jgi:hypothetical protein